MREDHLDKCLWTLKGSLDVFPDSLIWHIIGLVGLSSSWIHKFDPSSLADHLGEDTGLRRVFYIVMDRCFWKLTSWRSQEKILHKCISTLASLLPVWFENLTDWVLWRCRLPVLTKSVFAIGQGGVPITGRQCYRFSYQSSSRAEPHVGQTCLVGCCSAGQVVSRRDPIHVLRSTNLRPPLPPRKFIVRKAFEVKEN